jgi:hypothetical protein
MILICDSVQYSSPFRKKGGFPSQTKVDYPPKRIMDNNNRHNFHIRQRWVSLPNGLWTITIAIIFTFDPSQTDHSPFRWITLPNGLWTITIAIIFTFDPSQTDHSPFRWITLRNGLWTITIAIIFTFDKGGFPSQTDYPPKRIMDYPSQTDHSPFRWITLRNGTWTSQESRVWGTSKTGHKRQLSRASTGINGMLHPKVGRRGNCRGSPLRGSIVSIDLLFG